MPYPDLPPPVVVLSFETFDDEHNRSAWVRATDPRTGRLAASLSLRKMHEWLQAHEFHYVAPSNGVWSRN